MFAKTFLFKFEFFFEDEPENEFGETQSTMYAFKVSGDEPLLTKLHEIPYDDGAVSLFEDQFGVHDWCGNGDGHEINGLQFDTYEVSREDAPILMKKWNGYFKEKGYLVTVFLELDPALMWEKSNELNVSIESVIIKEIENHVNKTQS
jgi:hypothetical protein